jgi:NAD(P)-dependent dehydrogenase (short-subunit alcohol dehydrogenase family)
MGDDLASAFTNIGERISQLTQQLGDMFLRPAVAGRRQLRGAHQARRYRVNSDGGKVLYSQPKRCRPGRQMPRLNENGYPVMPYCGSYVECVDKPVMLPPQHQNRQPGFEYRLRPTPISDNPNYVGSGKLDGKVALITGGDSGLGRAVAIAFAKEGADVAIAYLDEERDAKETQAQIREYGGECLLLPGDLRSEAHSARVVNRTLRHFGRLDVLVLNQGVQFPQKSILDISAEQLDNTFRTNVYPHFYMTKAALPFLRPGSSIIVTASITAYRGTPLLVDYSATKGALVSFTRSLSLQLIDKGIRVNAVAPGPFWTPLIASSYSADYVATFGKETNMHRPGQPFEIAPTYVYLASEDSHFVSGQVLHVNGGIITQT